MNPVNQAGGLPTTRYARAGSAHVAYQVVGEGERDLVFVPPWVSHLETIWEEPGFARMCRRLASFARLILLDRRGVGMSDRVAMSGAAALDEAQEDVLAVMDAVGSERAVLFGGDVDSGPACMLCAARHPDRVSGLVLYGTFPRGTWAPDYPWGPTPEVVQETAERIESSWGGSFLLPRVAPSRLGDEAFVRWWARYQRVAASPGVAAAIIRNLVHVDVRAELGTIAAPTLVIHRTDDRMWSVEGAREIARLVPGATLVELPGEDHLPFVGDLDAVVDEIEAFVTGARPGPRASGWPAGLTDREVEILRAVAEGRRSKEVAFALGISVRTVNHHIDHIYEKVGIRNRAGIALFAREHGLLGGPAPDAGVGTFPD
jgi:pimeloyl-ACP methyl ester carboxylesterase/DNA-binding CsgD family transcriptional regulator